MDDEMYEALTGTIPPKVKTYSDARALMGKLGEKSAMWERVARDGKERSEEFERACQQVLAGATSVTVGRTTYVIDSDADTQSG